MIQPYPDSMLHIISFPEAIEFTMVRPIEKWHLDDRELERVMRL